ncbi:hypothetical protein DdX_20448 [Ditylenchus destructor]|uniref:Uncharacterized protein n=1 Tax=Ditylenchus destructor TaxID=166010 RepID=A0AAD4QRU6_9BILA|nr:hypothetical protein DdX_20448 [Ditylenchus destructor]
MKHTSAVRRTTSMIVPRASWLAVMSRKQSSSAPAASYARACSTGARVAQVHEVHALDDAAVGHCLGEVEAAIVQCAAGDDAFDPGLAGQRVDVGDVRHPAAGDHRDRDFGSERGGRLDITAFQQAVAADIGEQECGDAGILEPVTEFGDRDGRDVGPALGRDETVARIDCDDDLAGMRGGGFTHEIRVLECGSADHDAADAHIDPALDRGAVADAAAELNLARKAREDRGDRATIDRFAGECGIKIDDVEVSRARLCKGFGLRCGVLAIDGGAGHIPFGQTDDLTGLEVDGGKTITGSTSESVRAMPSHSAGSFRVELHPGEIVAADRGGDRAAMFGRGEHPLATIGEAVQEIGLARLDQRVGDDRNDIVPAHMGDTDIAGGQLADGTAKPAQALVRAQFLTGLRQQLHTDADAKKGAASLSTRWSSASTMPGIARSPEAQAPNAPTPGRTMRSAFSTASGSAVTATSAAPAALSALWTEWRLPAP